jgi:hypothetical protein
MKALADIREAILMEEPSVGHFQLDYSIYPTSTILRELTEKRQVSLTVYHQVPEHLRFDPEFHEVRKNRVAKHVSQILVGDLRKEIAELYARLSRITPDFGCIDEYHELRRDLHRVLVSLS